MDPDELSELINNLQLINSTSSNLADYSKMLKKLTELTRSDTGRHKITLSHWETLIKVADFSVSLLKHETWKDEEMDFLTDVLRLLRNILARCHCDELLLKSLTKLLSITLELLLKLDGCRIKPTDRETVALRCCLQVFGNLVCQNDALKDAVWSSFNEKDMFNALLKDKDLKVQEYTMMILYNCLTEPNRQHLVSTEEGHLIVKSLTDSLYHNIVDWGVLIMESLANSEHFMDKCYSILPTQNRLLFLDVLGEQLDNMENSNYCIAESNLKCIKDYFVEYVLNICKTSETNMGDLKSSEIVKLLSLLCAASVSSKCSGILKNYKDLLELSVDALKTVHLLGKHTSNSFSTIASLKDTHELSKEEIEDHPSYGFKKNLIRLIGNLCSASKPNQDLVRKMDGIPLLLDCCNMDARNPYIMQWCILAICNVVQNNPDNQAVLASVSISGEMADSPLLKELGLNVEIQDGRPVLKNVAGEDDT